MVFNLCSNLQDVSLVIPISLMETGAREIKRLSLDSLGMHSQVKCVKILICIISDPKAPSTGGFILVLRAAGRSPSVHSSGKEN